MVVSLEQNVIIKLSLQECSELDKELPGLESGEDTPTTDDLFEKLNSLLDDISDGNN